MARWAQDSVAIDAATVGAVVDWLEHEIVRAEAAERDLIGLGFVEVIPFLP